MSHFMARASLIYCRWLKLFIVKSLISVNGMTLRILLWKITLNILWCASVSTRHCTTRSCKAAASCALIVTGVGGCLPNCVQRVCLFPVHLLLAQAVKLLVGIPNCIILHSLWLLKLPLIFKYLVLRMAPQMILQHCLWYMLALNPFPAGTVPLQEFLLLPSFWICSILQKT